MNKLNHLLMTLPPGIEIEDHFPGSKKRNAIPGHLRYPYRKRSFITSANGFLGINLTRGILQTRLRGKNIRSPRRRPAGPFRGMPVQISFGRIDSPRTGKQGGRGKLPHRYSCSFPLPINGVSVLTEYERINF